MRCHWQWPRRRFQGKCSSTRFVGKTQNTIRWGVRIQLLTHKWLLMDDLTTGGLAGSEELSLAFFALVRGSVVTLVPLLAQVFEANWLACGQIIDKSVWMPPEPQHGAVWLAAVVEWLAFTVQRIIHCSHRASSNLPQHCCFGFISNFESFTQWPVIGIQGNGCKTGLLVIKKPLDCLGDAAGIAAKPLWSKSAIGQVVGHGEFANFCAR